MAKEDGIYAMRFASQQMLIDKLQQENANLKKDIEFCLHSIKQEMEMSTDERTRTEMKTCYEILRRYINES